MAIGGGRLWAIREKPATLQALDPHTLAPVAPPLTLSAGRVLGLAWGDGYLWATAADDGEILRIDPNTRAVTRARVGGFPIGVIAAGGSLWVIENNNATVLRLNPSSLRRIGQPIASPAGGAFYISSADGYLFIANDADGTITRIDEPSGKTAGPPIRIAPSNHTSSPQYPSAYAIAPAGAAIWATSTSAETISRIQARP
jgi:DNA-binding beta-propeller fold protein YncE